MGGQLSIALVSYPPYEMYSLSALFILDKMLKKHLVYQFFFVEATKHMVRLDATLSRLNFFALLLNPGNNLRLHQIEIQ